MNTKPTIVHFGAGNIGRSLVGTLFSRAGYEILFVDAAPAIVTALQQRHGYRVVIKDDLPPGAPSVLEVRGVDGIAASDGAAVAAAVARADLIGTSVGANALPAVLRSMAPGLAQRTRPVSILFCENLHDVVGLARQTLTASLPAGAPANVPAVMHVYDEHVTPSPVTNIPPAEDNGIHYLKIPLNVL